MKLMLLLDPSRAMDQLEELPAGMYAGVRFNPYLQVTLFQTFLFLISARISLKVVYVRTSVGPPWCITLCGLCESTTTLVPQ